MGILDDLAMGFGLKERTEDYDARTARTIAAHQRAGVPAGAAGTLALAQARNPSHSSYIGDDVGSTSSRARMFLDRAGRAGGYAPSGYNPQPAADNRPFMQRLITSPTGAASPRPYAIGPVTLDQPLPAFGLLGLFTKGLSNMFQGQDDSEASINVGERAMSMLPRTSTMNTPPTLPTDNGQPETTFDTRTEAEPIDYSDGISVTDPALIPAIEALALDDGYDPAYKDVEDYLQKVEREAQGMRLITRGPHAGKYVDASGRLVMP